MVHYQHYSFDLWLTLIRSNPLFKKERAAFFHRRYNGKKKGLDEVVLAFRQVDVMCNAINQKTGGNIDAEEMYLMVISMIHDYELSLDEVDTAELYNQMDALVANYLPEVYCHQTANVLHRLKQRENVSLSILSNTGFIKGATLRRILTHLELAPYFSFQLYSDELGLSKPSPLLFQHLLKNIAETRPGKTALKDIIHVGDNPVADAMGATAAGIKSLLINCNQTTITHLVA